MCGLRLILSFGISCLRTIDFMKLTTYLLFFSLIVVKHGLPLNMIRDVYITARSFVTRFRALTRYLSATRDMDRRYPNATEAELGDMSDRTCIICRDELAFPHPQVQRQAGPNTTPKKLPCGHIFHFNCLRSWLERQQNCPTWYVRKYSHSQNYTYVNSSKSSYRARVYPTTSRGSASTT